MYKIAVLGDTDSVMGFMAIGFAVHEAPDAASAAHALFAALRHADSLGVKRVFSEAYPEEGVGLALMNRMARAAGFDIVTV